MGYAKYIPYLLVLVEPWNKWHEADKVIKTVF